MQSLHNRLGVAVLSLASLTAPLCNGQEREALQKESTSPTSSLPTVPKILKGTHTLTSAEQMKIRTAEEEIKQALLFGLERVRSGSGPAVPVLVLVRLAELKNYTWRFDDKAGKAAAYIGDFSEVTVELSHLRAELTVDGGKTRSFSVYQGAWKDGKLDSPDDLITRYLAPDSIQKLVKALKKDGPIAEVPILTLREAWPEWRIIADDKAARAQFVKLIEFVLLKGQTLSESEQSTLIKTAKKCVKYE